MENVDGAFRWSAGANAINALQNGYFNFYEALFSIASDINQPGDTKNEIQSLAKKRRNSNGNME